MKNPSVATDYERAFGQLCHLVALNKTDKIEGARDNLVATTLVIDESSGHRSGLAIGAAVFVLFGVQLEAGDLDRSVETLLEAGHIFRRSDGVLQAGPELRAQVEARIKAARDLEDAVKSEWFEAAAELIGDVTIQESLWTCLRTYLALAFRRHGAETVSLLDPNASVPEGTLSAYFEDAVGRSGLGAHRAVAQSAVDVFFNPDPPIADR